MVAFYIYIYITRFVMTDDPPRYETSGTAEPRSLQLRSARLLYVIVFAAPLRTGTGTPRTRRAR